MLKFGILLCLILNRGDTLEQFQYSNNKYTRNILQVTPSTQQVLWLLYFRRKKYSVCVLLQGFPTTPEYFDPSGLIRKQHTTHQACFKEESEYIYEHVYIQPLYWNIIQDSTQSCPLVLLSPLCCSGVLDPKNVTTHKGCLQEGYMIVEF